ncbi:MAG TPA: 16S rRNA (guanine(966)-N(2))-methyltransferase RsmD [Vicinamibacterales bacterium]|nr:16S rRNA (guanine(966)-N(2))-methyltransferase RsmD [Vicinamibacterales bacterium]
MRIIAGSLKGRRLKGPTWEGLRPTSDKVRETLFNILASRPSGIAGARVLDGYAGTGAIGIEALSRGASHVTFVERDRRAQALIADNLVHCGIANGYAIIRASADRAFAGLVKASSAFDVVVLDPPYGEQPDAGGGSVLAHGGILVLERASRAAAPDAVGPLTRTRDIVSGDSALSFYAWPL